jgi:uncharacterized Zn finger protein
MTPAVPCPTCESPTVHIMHEAGREIVACPECGRFSAVSLHTDEAEDTGQNQPGEVESSGTEISEPD